MSNITFSITLRTKLSIRGFASYVDSLYDYNAWSVVVVYEKCYSWRIVLTSGFSFSLFIHHLYDISM